jgi:nucleoside-diphosphate-sugar epimerase
MRIVIIGALGFVGKHLGQTLAAQGHEVIGVTTQNQSNLEQLFVCYDVAAFYANSKKYQNTFDVVVNLAARRSSKLAPLSSETVFEYTFEIPKALIMFAAKQNALVLNVSTYIQNFRGINGETVDSYGAAKQEMSRFLSEYSRLHPINTVDLYLFTIYGQGDRPSHLVPSLVSAAATGNPINLSQGYQLMNLLNIEDLTVNISSILNWSNFDNYARFYMWDDNYLTVRELVKTLEYITQKEINCDWGARDYAGHEMFDPWPIPMERLPQFKVSVTLERGLTKLWDNVRTLQ